MDKTSPQIPFPTLPLRFFQIYGDFDDLVSALTANNASLPRPEPPNSVLGSGSCSAIIKVLPDNSDMLVGHNTWTKFTNMMRIYKLYELNYRISNDTNEIIPGHTQAFSSYPGRLYSGDDFYILSSGLVSVLILTLPLTFDKHTILTFNGPKSSHVAFFYLMRRHPLYKECPNTALPYVIVIPCMQRLHQFYQPEPEGES